mgnify:CR=1 FL=1
MFCIVSPTASNAVDADLVSLRFFGFIMLFAAIPTAAPTIMPVSAALVIVAVFFRLVFRFIFLPSRQE